MPTTKIDLEIISAIADRAVRMVSRLKQAPADKISIMMDLDCVHDKTPLRLSDLLEAKDGSFAHDVFGINRHLNRGTRELDGIFSPRYLA